MLAWLGWLLAIAAPVMHQRTSFLPLSCKAQAVHA
jgi:hypothetical protein